MTEAPRESQKFINLGIVRNAKGEILMIRRVKVEKGSDGKELLWAFPGGKQRISETREEGVRREILAETGYDVRPIKQLSLRIHPQIMILIAYHLCSLNFPEPVAEPIEQHEVAEIRWVPPAEISKLITTDLDPAVKKELRIV